MGITAPRNNKAVAALVALVNFILVAPDVSFARTWAAKSLRPGETKRPARAESYLVNADNAGERRRIR
jgi:hypothetical protein